jgi:hypothetical protein
MEAHEVLPSRLDEVIQRWRAAVQGTLAPESMSHAELVDALPVFLREILAALRESAGLTRRNPLPEESSTAAGHGQQRLRLGFSLDAVVREYGALKDAVIATAVEAGATLTVREQQVIVDSIITEQAEIVDEPVDRQQLDGCDLELTQVADDRLAREPQEPAAQLGRDVGVASG